MNEDIYLTFYADTEDADSFIYALQKIDVNCQEMGRLPADGPDPDEVEVILAIPKEDKLEVNIVMEGFTINHSEWMSG